MTHAYPLLSPDDKSLVDRVAHDIAHRQYAEAPSRDGNASPLHHYRWVVAETLVQIRADEPPVEYLATTPPEKDLP